MKKVIYNILLISCWTAATSCDDFLDLTPQGNENSGNYFNLPENAVYAVNGIYDMLQLDEGAGPDGQWLNHHHDFFLGDMVSDDAEKGSNTGDFSTLLDLTSGKSTAAHVQAEAFWIHGFWGVSRANYVIEGLADAKCDADLRDRLMGESLFLRGYFNWYLVSKFGPVPLFTSSVQPSDFGSVSRAELSEIYAQITKDLTEAAALLPERSEYTTSEMGRATRGAAKSLLARIHMYQIGTDAKNTTITWQNVYDLTSAVIKSGEYRLLDNYAKLIETEYENSEESIFEVQFGNGSDENAPGSIGTNYYQFQSNRVDASGWGFCNPTVDLVEAFEDGDPRLSCTIYGETFNDGILYGEKREYDREEQGSHWLNRKAALPTKPNIMKAADRNIKIIRYADVLLMHAEACCHLNKETEATEKLNMIRARARNSTYCMGYSETKQDFSAAPASIDGLLKDITGLSGQALLEAVWQERRVELAMEQMRFFDLVRTGRFLDTMSKEKEELRKEGEKYANDYSSEINKYFVGIKSNLASKCLDGPNGNKVYVLPIPQTEVQAWGISQNPGY